MKNQFIIVYSMLILIIGINSVYAWNITSFNNSLSSENMIFNSSTSFKGFSTNYSAIDNNLTTYADGGIQVNLTKLNYSSNNVSYLIWYNPDTTNYLYCKNLSSNSWILVDTIGVDGGYENGSKIMPQDCSNTYNLQLRFSMGCFGLGCASKSLLYETWISTDNNPIEEYNLVRYIRIPQSVSAVTNAYLNLTGNKLNPNNYSCYQEFSNVSTACGGISTGTYAISNFAFTPDNAYDGVWNTYAQVNTNVKGVYEVNYSFPSYPKNVTSAILQIDYLGTGSSIHNQTIPSSCLNGVDKVNLRLETLDNSTLSYINLTCRTPSSFAVINYTVGAAATYGQLFEEAIIWNITNYTYPTNLGIIIDNTLPYNHTGIFNLSNNKTENIYSYINSYLSICSFSGGYCNVPFIFASTAWGILQYSGILINNEGFIENSQTYNATAYETSNQIFSLNLTYDYNEYSSIAAKLWYNGTSYTATKYGSTSNILFSKSLDLPTVNSQVNNSFFWQVILTNSSSTVSYNLSVYNQTVNKIVFGACAEPYSFPYYLNFTTYDGATGDIINASLEANVQFYAGSGTTKQNFTFSSINEGKSNWILCLNETDLNITIDGFFSYYQTGYDTRQYIINAQSTSTIEKNIPLYLSATADTDIVSVSVKDQNYNPITGALVAIQKWNVGTGTYSTIGMFYTDNNGEGIINLELYNVWYRAVIYYGGNIVEVTNVKKLDSTTWSIQITLGTDNPYLLFGNVSHGLVFNNQTNITTFTWLDTGGYVHQGCLRVRESTNLGYQTISLECVTSSSGTITSLLSGNGTFEVAGFVYLDESYNISKTEDVIYIRMSEPDIVKKASPYGKVISLVFIGTSSLIGVSASNPYLGLFLLVVSIVTSGKLGWLNITDQIIWGIISIVIILAVRITRK